MKSFTQKSELFWTYVLFMLWPLFAVVRGFKNIGQAYARTIIILFFGLFGLHLVFDLSDDSSRHEASFLRITQMPFSEFFNIVSGLYSDEGQKPDFVMDLIGFVVSRLTSDSSIYFMTLGLVLGWVVVKNMSILYELYLQKKTTIGLIFVIFFIFMMGPVRLLSFRHYLGLAVYVLAIYQYLKGGKNYYLLLIVSSVFMHFAFLMVVPLFFLYRFVGNRNFIYYTIILLSFIFAELTTGLIRQYGSGLNAGIEEVVKGYTHKTYLASVDEMKVQRNFILTNYMRWTTVYLLGVLIFHKIRYRTFDLVSESLYSFCLLYFSFVNFTVGLESISNRFSIVFQVLVCYFMIHLYSNNDIKVNKIFKYSMVAVLILNAVIQLRLTIEYMNFLLLIPFLPLTFFIDSDVAILNLLK